MGGKVIGHRIVTYQQSVEVAPRQYVDMIRIFIHALHSTKGWRKAGSKKIMQRTETPNYKLRVTKEFKPL